LSWSLDSCLYFHRTMKYVIRDGKATVHRDRIQTLRYVP
jgi:hypothetical protein